MTRARRERLRGLGIAAVGLLLALLPSQGHAEEEALRLPFLLADGATRAEAPVEAVLLPEWDELWTDLEELEPQAGPAYPDVSDLLREFPGAGHGGDGRIGEWGPLPERPRAVRLLRAVDAGFGARVRIDVEVRSSDRAEPFRVSGTVRPGSLLVADAREERVYPANLHLQAAAACAEMALVRVGPRVVASAAPAGDFHVLRLAVHTSRVVGETRFEARRLTLVAPRLAFSSLVIEAPAAPGEEETIRCGDLVVTYRVTPTESPEAPEGTRALCTDAAVPLFAAAPLPEPGTLRLEADGFDDVVEQPPWIDAARPGVRNYPVPPGLVVLEGKEDAIHAELTSRRAAWRTWRAPTRLRLVADSGCRLDAPLCSPARLAYVSGLIDPVVSRTKPAIEAYVAQTGPVLARLFTGTTLEIAFDADGRPRLTEVHAGPTDIRPRVIPIVVRQEGVERRDRLPGSDWSTTTERMSRLLRPDEILVWRKEG